jgi:hypothetical protein
MGGEKLKKLELFNLDFASATIVPLILLNLTLIITSVQTLQPSKTMDVGVFGWMLECLDACLRVGMVVWTDVIIRGKFRKIRGKIVFIRSIFVKNYVPAGSSNFLLILHRFLILSIIIVVY